MRQRVTSAPSKMMFYTTSARKDPSLARNRFKLFGGGGVSDVRSDYGTTRNNQDSSRDRAADDDHPQIVTIGTEDKEASPADFVDEIGDAILEANESMWQLIFHNDAMAKIIFPVEGNGEVESHGDDDSLGDGGTILQATSVDYFMNCTQTTFDGSAVEMTNSVYEAAPTSDAPKKKSGGLLGMRRKKTKSNNGQGSTNVLDAIAEGGELGGGVAETRQEGDGVSVASSAGSDGLVRESMALLTIYNKSIDADEEEQDQEVNEKEENEKEDEQKQEEQEEGVEAVTAIALCGDETTVVSSDEQEMTLQEYSTGAVTTFALVGDENTIVSSDQQEVTLQDFTGEQKPRKKLLDVNAILCQNPEHVLDDDYTTGLASDASSTSSSSTTILTEKASLKDGGGNGSVSKKSQSSKKGKGGVIEDTFEPEKVLVGVPTLDMNVTSFDISSQKNDDVISTISMQTDLKSRADNTTGGLGYGRSLLNALTGYTGENVEGESRVTEKETTFNATTFDGSIGSGPPMTIEESYTDGTEEPGPISSRWACLGKIVFVGGEVA